MFLLDLIVSMSLTLFIYFLIPVVIILLGKKFKISTLKIITVINCILGFSFFTVLQYFTNPENSPNFTAALLWSSFTYILLKKKASLNSASSDSEDFDNNSIACKTTETNLPKKSFLSHLTACFIILNIILICIICVSLHTNYQLRDEVNKLKIEISELQIDSENVHEKILSIEDVLSDIGATGQNINGNTYLEYRLDRIEKQLNLGSGELLNANGETVEEWRSRTNQD